MKVRHAVQSKGAHGCLSLLSAVRTTGLWTGGPSPSNPLDFILRSQDRPDHLVPVTADPREWQVSSPPVHRPDQRWRTSSISLVTSTRPYPSSLTLGPTDATVGHKARKGNGGRLGGQVDLLGPLDLRPQVNPRWNGGPTSDPWGRGERRGWRLPRGWRPWDLGMTWGCCLLSRLTVGHKWGQSSHGQPSRLR